MTVIMSIGIDIVFEFVNFLAYIEAKVTFLKLEYTSISQHTDPWSNRTIAELISVPNDKNKNKIWEKMNFEICIYNSKYIDLPKCESIFVGDVVLINRHCVL